MYILRKLGGRGLKSIEREYKQEKIKAAVRLYINDDPAMELVRQFEEKGEKTGRRPLVRDSKLNIQLLIFQVCIRAWVCTTP